MVLRGNKGKQVKRLKLKSALLSTAAMLAVAATVTSTGSIAGNNAASELSSVQDLLNSVASNAKKAGAVDPNSLKTKTPIKHLVVVFNENRSFDHYFGTYPNAMNPEGEPIFEPAKNTPRDINNLTRAARRLLDNNPNLNAVERRHDVAVDRSVSIAPKSTPPTRTTATRPSKKPLTAANSTSSR